LDKQTINFLKLQEVKMVYSPKSSTITTSTGTVVLGVRDSKNSGVVASLSGTHSGFTVVFEGSNDGTTWYKVPACKLASGNLEIGSTALADNATVAFYLASGVFGKVRVRATARSSGTLAVSMLAAPSLVSPVNNMQYFVGEDIGKKTVAVTAGASAGNSVAVATGPGFLHKIVVTTAGATAGVIIYDNATTNSGTKVYSSAATHALGVYDIKMPFVNGLTVRKDSTTAAFTIVYSLIN
jgi:hypothetical protein